MLMRTLKKNSDEKEREDDRNMEQEQEDDAEGRYDGVNKESVKHEDGHKSFSTVIVCR